MDKSGLQECMMGRGAKIFFLSALVAGCVFGLVSFLLISSLTSDGTAKAQNNGNMETVMTVFCLDECDMLCSIVKISVGEIVNIDFEIPDAKTAEVFCTRGYVAVLDGLGKSDYYAIVPHGAIGAIASKLGVPAPSSRQGRSHAFFNRGFVKTSETGWRQDFQHVFRRTRYRSDSGSSFTNYKEQKKYKINKLTGVSNEKSGKNNG